jgi:DNA-binding transcriptional MerR regulator
MTLFSTTEAARRLGIHPSRVRRLADRYKIGQKTDGGARLFTMHDFRQLERRSTGRAGRPKTPTE